MTSQFDKLDKDTRDKLVEDIKKNCEEIEFILEDEWYVLE